MSTQASRSIVIVGGGIVGASIAYYLSKHAKAEGISVHLVEATAIAAAASGKAGGLIARDWHSSSTSSLAKLSYDLHQALAKEHNGEKNWGFRLLHTLSVDKHAGDPETKSVESSNWLDAVTAFSVMGTTDTTAQIQPQLFTEFLVSAAQERGVKVTFATVNGLEWDNGALKGVRASNDQGSVILPATDVILAAGPWTGRLAKQLLGDRAGVAKDIYASKSTTSIVVRSPTSGLPTPHALFLDLTMPDGSAANPEVYPRPDGTVYICGHSGPWGQPDLPEDASGVEHSDVAVEHLLKQVQFVTSYFDNVDVETKQACFRPESPTRSPLVGKLLDGVWIAAGHSVWGISNACGTGLCMAELMLDGEVKSADISGLAPP